MQSPEAAYAEESLAQARTQVWPRELCHVLAAGIQGVLEIHYQAEHLSSLVPGNKLQSTACSSDGRPEGVCGAGKDLA